MKSNFRLNAPFQDEINHVSVGTDPFSLSAHDAIINTQSYAIRQANIGLALGCNVFEQTYSRRVRRKNATIF